jgi:hypothetical protein
MLQHDLCFRCWETCIIRNVTVLHQYVGWVDAVRSNNNLGRGIDVKIIAGSKLQGTSQHHMTEQRKPKQNWGGTSYRRRYVIRRIQFLFHFQSCSFTVYLYFIWTEPSQFYANVGNDLHRFINVLRLSKGKMLALYSNSFISRQTS